MSSLRKRTEPSPRTAFTPPGCMLRGGRTLPPPQSWAPPGQQSWAALGQLQFGVAAALNNDCPAAYHSGKVPLFDFTPIGLVLAAVPIVPLPSQIVRGRLPVHQA